MFDFLFKRKPKTVPPATAAHAPSASQLAAQDAKKQQSEQARNAALARLENIAQDEAAVTAFLLACDFADGRLKAAHYIYGEVALNQVLAATRNTDRRVAKLMQSRLDVIHAAGRQRSAAQACIAAAAQMQQTAHLMANQVVELDKQAAAVKEFPQELKQEFDALRAQLENRLQAQTALQRKVLNLIARLHEMAGVDAARLEPEQAQHALGMLQGEFDSGLAQPEAVSLPKNLAQEFAQEIAELRKTVDAQLEIARKQAEEHARAEKKAADKAASIAAAAAALSAQASQVADELAARAETASSDAGPVDADGAPAETAVPREAREKKNLKDKPALAVVSVEKILASINGMEEALAQGSVQAAIKFDRELRAIDTKASGLPLAERDRLLRVRSELGHLQGWAKWGGGVSRDELVKTAEELPVQKLEPNELAKRVADLRERWKSMEAVSGSASKDVWERFDAACSLAYAPAAAYFQQLGEERKANLETADAMIAELRSHAALLEQQPVDWKGIVNLGVQARQKWQTLGPVDRKHRPRLESEFDAAYKILWAPLEQRRKQEIADREAMIAEAQALSPDQRSVVDEVRALQARWQEQAGSVPLKRKDEQALWEKFRAACDAIFAQRRAASETADSQRKDNLQAKETVCAGLEQARDALDSDQAIRQLLQQSAAAWRDIGYVPRADEAAIEQRYKNAVSALEAAAARLLREKDKLANQALQQRIVICHTLEKMLVLDTADEARVAQLSAEWAGLPPLQAKADAAMQRRFSAIVKALQEQDQAYVGTLRDNADRFDQALLQLEVVASVDSPEEFSRERLQMQVKVLQSSLQSGSRQPAVGEQLRNVCALPALTNDKQMQRLAKILAASTV
ncbi:DUF349 domain-containing protein [Undibacterium sp. TJN25]|uniref:DUF349 domain-containing protein n=1 Tax=Undibacterium sp. TJN25 TaxID=3413056 RepID=UPI003BF1C7D8